MVSSFAERFSLKQDSEGNSIQQEIILDAMKAAEESLADRVSQATSSESNMDAVLNLISAEYEEHSQIDKSAEELKLGQEIEEYSSETLLQAIELARNPEELSKLMQIYKERVADWGKEITLLRDEKHLREYLSVVAALNIWQKMLQNPELFKGKDLTDLLKNSLKANEQNIADKARLMQEQNNKLHEQKQQMVKQLSAVEKSLLATIDALKQNPGKLSPQELQLTLKYLNDALKQVQQLKADVINGKQVDLTKGQEFLQKLETQNQRLLNSGKLGEQVVNALKMAQQNLLQTRLDNGQNIRQTITPQQFQRQPREAQINATNSIPANNNQRNFEVMARQAQGLSDKNNLAQRVTEQTQTTVKNLDILTSGQVVQAAQLSAQQQAMRQVLEAGKQSEQILATKDSALNNVTQIAALKEASSAQNIALETKSNIELFRENSPLARNIADSDDAECECEKKHTERVEQSKVSQVNLGL